jgi:hypothetical protein
MTFLELGILRLIIPLVILRYPLPGILAAQVLDKYDWKLLPFATEGDYVFYQYWDKSLDSFYLTLALIVSQRWPNQFARRLAVATYSYRMVGVGLFFIFGDQRLFLLFPNIFEGLFVFIEVYLLITGGAVLFRGVAGATWLVAAVSLPRWIREYFIHVAGDWPWNMWTVLHPALDVRLWQGTYLAFPIIAMLVVLAREKRLRGRVRLRDPDFGLRLELRQFAPLPLPIAARTLPGEQAPPDI